MTGVEGLCLEDNGHIKTASALVPPRVALRPFSFGLERFQAKWIPVRMKKTRQNKKIEPRSDSIGTEKARASVRRLGVVRAAARLIAVVPLHHLHWNGPRRSRPFGTVSFGAGKIGRPPAHPGAAPSSSRCPRPHPG